MPKFSASHVSRKIFATLFLFVLTACSADDISLPKLNGVEVPDQVLNEPRVVPTPPADEPISTDYPLLGAVPSKPKNFTPQPIIDATKAEMRNDRDDANHLRDNYLATPPAGSATENQ